MRRILGFGCICGKLEKLKGVKVIGFGVKATDDRYSDII